MPGNDYSSYQGEREAFDYPGNGAVPNRPLTLPGIPTNAQAPGLRPLPGMGGGIGGGLSSADVNDPSRFQNFIGTTIILTVGTDAILLSEPASPRTFMSIKNASNSTGILAIGLTVSPSNLQAALWEINPGGILWFDMVVPQNIVYGFASGGTCNVAVAYSNR